MTSYSGKKIGVPATNRDACGPVSARTIPVLRAFTPQTLLWRVCKTAFTPMGRALRTHPKVRALPCRPAKLQRT